MVKSLLGFAYIYVAAYHLIPALSIQDEILQSILTISQVS
jgi:hypothetical protein